MSDIADAIQKLSPEQRKFFYKKLREGMDEIIKKFEEESEKYAEGKKVPKSLRQFIPYTDEAWEKEMEKQRQYKTLKKDKHYIKSMKEVNSYLQKHLYGYIEEHTTSV